MKINKNFLQKEYETKSIVKIAKENRISNSVLYRLFEKYQIKRRTQKEAGIFRIIKHSCIDCGKQVSRKEYKRCVSCQHKLIHKEYFCEVCGKKISNSNGLYGKHRCAYCANKGFNNPMSGKKKFLAKHHIDLNRENNKKSNLLKIPQNVHSSLHHRAYDYLVKIGLIKEYIKWFFKNYAIDLDKNKK